MTEDGDPDKEPNSKGSPTKHDLAKSSNHNATDEAKNHSTPEMSSDHDNRLKQDDSNVKLVENDLGNRSTPVKDLKDIANDKQDHGTTNGEADGGEKELNLEKTSQTVQDTSKPLGTSTQVNSGPEASKTDRPASPKRQSHRFSGLTPGGGISEFSHQQIVRQKGSEQVQEEEEEVQWQDMPAFAQYDMYDDDGKLVAKETHESDEENAYSNLGGAGKGYTRVQGDEDAQSATSMDENTAYLFKETTMTLEEDEEARDPLAQMQATKDLLTDNQRIAYVGVVRLAMAEMQRTLERFERTRGDKKQLDVSTEGMKMWSQKMMVRLYGHMELDPKEQIMIEQLVEHGLQPGDLTPSLMQNSRVKNPVLDDPSLTTMEAKVDSQSNDETSQKTDSTKLDSSVQVSRSKSFDSDAPPPPYSEGTEIEEVKTPSQLPQTSKIDIDLRWTVLCDLFLLLIADSVYDARSRTLLERVGEFLHVDWKDVCKFEKRVTDSLEMQEAANKETWDEKEHMESRRKMAKRRRLIVMGLATVGGGLVIGLSAGALAPLIGAGLAAGFTTIGVTGTGTFLAGAGGAAIIGSTGVVTGGTIGVRAANNRTGAVKTFEYRPLHNNKRVNLIVTVAGWLNGKVDDVRLPYSTVDPIMGDLYSIHWEPEMLRSMGQTINILATEALTQGLQQLLGSTILIPLMAALQIPIVLSKLSYLIDNPWTNSVARADSAGLILADSLIDRNLGARPITLIGFSLGSRLIFSCLKELARRGALGLIQNVYLFGAPVVAKKDEFLRVMTVVSGRFLNGYATNDWILAYLFRATSGGLSRVAGLAPVEIPGVENLDVTEWVNGHMAYRKAMPRMLREIGFSVTGDEFAEIEDPDPDNHEKRQRELINEIEEARKELQEKPEKKKWGIFNRRKMAEKKKWETYDDRSMKADDPGKEGDPNGDPMFNVEAIRAEAIEIAAQGLEAKQLESTLGTLKVDSTSPPLQNGAFAPRPISMLKGTRSHDGRSSIDVQTPSEPRSAKSVEIFDQSRHDPDAEESISMTFDTAYREKPKQSSVNEDDIPSLYPARQASMKKMTKSQEHLHSLYDGSSWGPQSTANKTGSQAPADVNRNVWADEEEEFAHEKEVSMTFE